jgi:hypothetical protein
MNRMEFCLNKVTEWDIKLNSFKIEMQFHQDSITMILRDEKVDGHTMDICGIYSVRDLMAMVEAAERRVINAERKLNSWRDELSKAMNSEREKLFIL